MTAAAESAAVRTSAFFEVRVLPAANRRPAVRSPQLATGRENTDFHRFDDRFVMNCQELAQKIETMQPGAETKDVARLCLLLANATNNVDVLRDERKLTATW